MLQTAPALPSGVDAKAKGGSELSLGPLQVATVKGLVQGYSRTAIKTAFRPETVGMVQHIISLSFRQGVAAEQKQKHALALCVQSFTRCAVHRQSHFSFVCVAAVLQMLCTVAPDRSCAVCIVTAEALNCSLNNIHTNSHLQSPQRAHQASRGCNLL